jgi:hypothetical protein
MIGIFLKQKLKKILSNALSMEVVLKKSLEYLLWLWVVCYLKNGDEKCQNIAEFSPKKRNFSNFS